MAGHGDFGGTLEQDGPCRWRIPKSYREDMCVDGLIFADEKLIAQIRKDQGPEQVANVATLPGIQRASLAMPDIHWGSVVSGLTSIVLAVSLCLLLS